MHYNYLGGTFTEMLTYSRQIVEAHGDKTDPMKDIVTRYRQLSTPYEEKAYWFLITDAFYNVIGTCMIAEDDHGHTSEHHFLITEGWKGLGFDRKLREMIEMHAHH
jgi:hypothetical protein